jgi:uncharacterized protein
MNLADPAHMTVRGEFAERLARAVEHLLSLNTAEMRRELAAPDARWHWGADYMGRWLGTMALLSRHTGQNYNCAAVAQELIDFQRPDGSFGTYGDEHDYQEWFGMGRGLVGLLDYHSATGDPAALQAARRLGDYYAACYPAAAGFMRECYASGLEGLVELARLTGDERHLQTAIDMAEASPVYRREWYSTAHGPRGRRAPCGGHVHCQLSTARGLLDLYQWAREARYLEPVLALHTFIEENALWISGGVGFYFNRPEENEACADADWLRLNLQLWQLTGAARYLDHAETALLNQLYFAQVDSGAFCYLRGLQNRGGAVFDVCCSHHGPRAIWEVMRHAMTADACGIWVNLLFDGVVRLLLPESAGHEVHLDSSIRYEQDNVMLALTMINAPVPPVRLNVRVPAWAGRADVTVNGQVELTGGSSGLVQVERAWQSGDCVEVRYPREIRVLRGQRLGRHVTNANKCAITYGPHVYCASDRWNPGLNLHFLRVRWLAETIRRDFSAIASNRLETNAVDEAGNSVRLVLSPLHEVGGVANGIGRSHPVSTSPFRVWLPLVGET